MCDVDYIIENLIYQMKHNTPAVLNRMDIRRILSIQMDHFYCKDSFWYIVTILQAFLLFYFLPIIGR